VTAFETGLAIGATLGTVFGICVSFVVWKWEARRERKMGYVTHTTYTTSWGTPPPAPRKPAHPTYQEPQR
jgi:hypothetical protein